jgi:hypothetical protein
MHGYETDGADQMKRADRVDLASWGGPAVQGGGVGTGGPPAAAGRTRPGVAPVPPAAGQVGKVAVARMAPVVVMRRAPVSGPLVAGSGLPQYP